MENSLAYVKNSISKYIVPHMLLVEWVLKWLNLCFNSFLCRGVSHPELFPPWSPCSLGCVAHVPPWALKESWQLLRVNSSHGLKQLLTLQTAFHFQSSGWISLPQRCQIWWRPEEAALWAGFTSPCWGTCLWEGGSDGHPPISSPPQNLPWWLKQEQVPTILRW